MLDNTSRRYAYKTIAHTADFMIHIEAQDIESLVEGTVMALSDSMFGLENLRPQTTKVITVSFDDVEMLIFQVASEVVFMFDTETLIPARVEAKMADDRTMEVVFICDRFDEKRHKPRVIFKAPTLHGLKVSRKKGKLFVRILMDV
jgi:SHS2 domain-containing protein